MADVNITTVYLLNIPLENDYKHTFYFNTKAEQTNFFLGKVSTNNLASNTDFSYQRKDSVMRIPVPYDEALKYNYVMYQNTAYSPKFFYAFITDYEFKREDLTFITIETDVIQTWMFDYTVNPSFIEREHTNDDTIGLHTVPENLEIGDPECVNYTSDPELINTEIVVGTTVDLGGENISGGNYNGIYSGVKYYSHPTGSAGSLFVNAFIKTLTDGDGADFKGGKIEALQCIFLAPKFLINDGDEVLEVNHSNTVKAYQHTLSAVNPYSSKVKNNKCLTFPYRYILVSNNNGGSAVYKYEKFKDGILNFSIQGALTPGCSIRLIPKEYNGVYVNNEEGLNLGKYPVCNWASDVYTNWLTQNSVNIGLNIASGIGQIVSGVAIAGGTGGLATAVGGSQIVGGVSAITQQLAQIHQMSFTPPQSHGNINCGDVITASETNTFHFYQMCVKEEYINIIDNYFTMFGYKTNRVKTPLRNHRKAFWYIKTIDVNVTGSVPIKDLQKIKDCYNLGITFWSDKNHFKNYNVDNSIINGVVEV